MAQPSLDALLYAIAGQESGGMSERERYRVVNAWGAVGKYQVLKSNIPSWSREVLGYSISWQTYRDRPDLQEKIVRGRMGRYYSKYGFRGAASAWYSGNPSLHQSTRPQPGGPSIKGYVDSVYNRALKYKGGGSSGGMSGSKAKASAEKERERTADEIAEDYGFSEALFNSSPELKRLFKRAIDGGWEIPKFQAELRDTKWWKTHSRSEQKYLADRYGDPATAKQNMRKAYVRVRQLANQMGLVESKSLLKKMNTWAYNVVAKDWDDSQLRNEIGKFVYFAHDKWQGEGGETQEKLREYAYSMGVTMSGQWYADKSRNVIRGLATVQDYESEIRKQAKATYSQWGKQIDGGQTVMDLASPYMQSMSTILELPAGSINLHDSTIKKALQGKDKNTGANMVIPLWQFENELRNDPRWKKTKNAQDSLMGVAHQVLTDFGVKT